MDIQTYRKQHKLSQAALAAQLGVTQTMISQIEKGRRPVPPELAITLEDLSGGALVSAELCPRLRRNRVRPPAADPATSSA